MRRAHFLTFAVVALMPLAAVAEDTTAFPSTVSYEGTVAPDLQGTALDGTYPVELRYLDTSGAELFVETMPSVSFTAGRFAVELGTGEAASDARYASLHEVLAANPELAFEVTIGETQYGPPIGVLPAGHSLKTFMVAAGVRPPQDGARHWKGYEKRSTRTAFQATVLAPLGGAGLGDDAVAKSLESRPFEFPVTGPVLSVPARDLPVAAPFTGQVEEEADEINAPRHETLYDENGNLFGTTAPKVQDQGVHEGEAPTGSTPGLLLDFEGIGVNGFLPPDNEGTVGPNHYIQMVNVQTAIYDKTGATVSGPFNTNTLWGALGAPCSTQNDGDAIALYDETADRFILTQFAVETSNTVCFAVSQTADPTGSYFLYAFQTPRFPDYYKLGVWPATNQSAFLMGTNSGSQNAYDGFAIDRDHMLAGTAARPIQAFLTHRNLLMPADVDGPTPPGPNDPGLFYTFRDGGEPYFGTPPSDSIDIWELDVDWTTPANSTLTLAQSLTPAGDGMLDFNWTVCGFFVQNCLPQPDTAQGLDSGSWWPMQRLVYRNFGGYEVLLGSWTVDVNAGAPNRAAPRWFELRRSGGSWSFQQQGTQSPDTIHRWEPSIAMDSAGNIALGYSYVDGTHYPSIYYATRAPGDAGGTLQAEAILFTGTGSQTHSAARWGDYASMELDPADGCTFWYQNEYLVATSSANWHTRIGAFQVPGCSDLIFSDGFESGDTSGWDNTVQ
jgi:hypothetical protein